MLLFRNQLMKLKGPLLLKPLQGDYRYHYTTFYLLINYVIIVADLCRSRTPLFISNYIKIHYFDLIQVREGQQGKDLRLCTYQVMNVARKLKFISSNRLEINRALSHNDIPYFLIQFPRKLFFFGFVNPKVTAHKAKGHST